MTDLSLGAPHGSSVVLVVEFTARADTVDELRERLLELTRLTRAEDGCLRYDLHADAGDPLRLVFVEEWSSTEAHAAHDRTPWVAGFREHRVRLLAEDGLRRLDLTRLEP
jgi:quinol monooxygenase YgiN